MSLIHLSFQCCHLLHDIGKFRFPPGGRDSVGRIFNGELPVSDAAPRSPYKAVSSPHPLPTTGILHCDTDTGVEAFKPLRKQSLTTLNVSRNSMKNILHNPQISPCNQRRVRVSPGGPSTIVLG